MVDLRKMRLRVGQALDEATILGRLRNGTGDGGRGLVLRRHKLFGELLERRSAGRAAGLGDRTKEAAGCLFVLMERSFFRSYPP